MKFDYIIGNPPYQEENSTNNRQSPVYNTFMDAAYDVGNVVELITPARFLFDAGQTPKSWNKKMLEDEHLKVLEYEPDASKVFPNTDIKGGLAVTLRNESKDFGAIQVFIANPQLNAVKEKVVRQMRDSLMNYAYPKSNFAFTEKLYIDHPKLKTRLTSGNELIIDAAIFDKMPEVFSETFFDGCIAVHGRQNNKRICKYISCDYIKKSEGVDKYKVFLPGANGSGEFGCILSNPFVGKPYEVGTQTYMSFGFFNTEQIATNLILYLKTKFARCMLGILKVTQNNPISTWKYVPLQDFTENSDIDWSKSIHGIDLQLYEKYGLDEKEIEFIETHVKEMA